MAVLVAGAAFAQEPPVPGWKAAGSNPKAFEMRVDRETFHAGGASAVMRCRSKHCSGFGTLMQVIRSDEYVGQRVRLSGWVMATNGARARLWMRIDGEHGEMLQFDNMNSRAKSGPFEWREMAVVLDVPPAAALINFGLILDSGGAAWMDDLQFEVVPSKIKSTNTLMGVVPARGDYNMRVRKIYYDAPAKPRNLDFEEK
jgi:hypothetical protein